MAGREARAPLNPSEGHMSDDPNRIIPIARHPENLGIELKSVNGVYHRASNDRDFPPIYKIHCKNYVMACDLERYRDVLARRKAERQAKSALASSKKRRADHDP